MVAVLETRPEHATSGWRSGEGREKRDLARVELEGAGHDEGLALYWATVAREAWFRCRAEETAAACELALAHAERAGSPRRAREAASWMSISSVFGPIPVPEAIERVERIRELGRGSVLSEADSSVCIGMLAGLQGDFERGRALVRTGVATFREAGLAVSAAGMSMGEAWVEYWAGDRAASEDVLRSSLQVLERVDDRGFRPTVALQLAELLYQENRFDEAEALCGTGRAYTTPSDLVNFVYLDMIEGGMRAWRGEHAEAEDLVRRAVTLAETTDFYWLRGASLLRLAEVHALAGRTLEASAEAAEGLASLHAKGDVVNAALARERLVTVGIEVGSQRC